MQTDCRWRKATDSQNCSQSHHPSASTTASHLSSVSQFCVQTIDMFIFIFKKHFSSRIIVPMFLQKYPLILLVDLVLLCACNTSDPPPPPLPLVVDQTRGMCRRGSPAGFAAMLLLPSSTLLPQHTCVSIVKTSSRDRQDILTSHPGSIHSFLHCHCGGALYKHSFPLQLDLFWFVGEVNASLKSTPSSKCSHS